MNLVLSLKNQKKKEINVSSEQKFWSRKFDEVQKIIFNVEKVGSQEDVLNWPLISQLFT